MDPPIPMTDARHQTHIDPLGAAQTVEVARIVPALHSSAIRCCHPLLHGSYSNNRPLPTKGIGMPPCLHCRKRSLTPDRRFLLIRDGHMPGENICISRSRSRAVRLMGLAMPRMAMSCAAVANGDDLSELLGRVRRYRPLEHLRLSLTV
jgi:hypothetical protein